MAQIFLFAQDSLSGELIGLRIGDAYGVAVCVLPATSRYSNSPIISHNRGFRTRASRTPLRQYPGVISELITVSRSPLVQAYVIIIVIAVRV